MFDINNEDDVQVIQREQDTSGATYRNLFVLSTENVRPCFAMLKSVRPIRDISLLNACQEIDSSLYLSSYLYLHNVQKRLNESTPHIIEFCGFITPSLLASGCFGTFGSLFSTFETTLFGEGSLMRAHYTKCA